MRALRQVGDARAALDAVAKNVSEQVEARWNTELDGGQPRMKNDYLEKQYRPYPKGKPITGWGKDTRFAWGIIDLTFFAGVCFTRDGTLDRDEAWQFALECRGHWNNEKELDPPWWTTYLPISEVTALPDIETQAAHVANFVIKAFNEVGASRPAP
jgi:hypothetical protein